MRILLFCTLALALVVLAGWRYSDHRADRMEMAHLLALQPKVPMLFDHAMIASLPEPAQRYFRFTIAQGTPLLPVAKLSMTGLFSLGDKDQPNYMKMQAHQVLAPRTALYGRCAHGRAIWECQGWTVQVGCVSG